ncbi:hypothetical protein GCM10023115_41560 [Pontixanthobacter gangjinensis]|uniref:DUF2927 domain-containing protein n=1 Tax=Christiangramia aestuarii TaxID=1028746 RepID=A0A7K1LRN4_9FLAO|nr:DUF2927 domain-containing protein [Christiangramia aestuarii]MUP43457.1 DUF2927 domain-containing protein [Christiangramia aestuarii]
MNNRFSLLVILSLIISSCSKDNEDITPVSELSEYQKEVVNYYKDIALGFEFGTASNVTRKWYSDLRIFIGGEPDIELRNELEKIKTEINELATDGFKVKIVNDSLQSNYYIFFGSGKEYAKIFPNQANFVDSNWGLFYVNWNRSDHFTSGYMYVDITRANATEQKHLLREELTQSLGLAKDSPLYMDSIFQSSWTNTTQYASIDKDLIRLLYNPNMRSGLNENQVDEILKEILTNE